MINEKELETVNLSATKKDFYQIWNELMDTAKKLSNRWDPSATNESDPGVVLLKVLTAIADKLNYTIDKNTLEAFMPSAAQEESMRKLCDMMGYFMKYYQSATTDATIVYTGEKDIAQVSVFIPKYTNLKNADNDVNYFTLEDVNISGNTKSQVVPCMEGELCLCADDTDNIVTIAQIDDNQRYYLPENQVAENGVFITNINDGYENLELWNKVDNLNTQSVGSHCFKFGYDSILQRPYIQFPEDISTIIEDGLIIRYTRTNGANGNISYNTLSKLEEPAIWSEADSDIYTADNFTVKNASAAVNGRDKESINDAYNAYKRTIGTFDTLVTCRDYMNKIYQMTTSDANTTPLVSNILVSDIRDDINRAITLCTFGEYGIAYIDQPLVAKWEEKEADLIFTQVSSLPDNPGEANLGITYKCNDKYYRCQKIGETEPYNYEFVRFVPELKTKYNAKTDRISHFDLVLYPFTTISGSVDINNYKDSFKLSFSNISEITQNLESNKTISHRFVYPNLNTEQVTTQKDIACIKNYLRLKAKITTTTKVNAIEEAAILQNIYNTIYENFNARKVDFGDEIPFDTILAVIQVADARIKNVALEEPILYTVFEDVNGKEYDSVNTETSEEYKKIYNRLALRNVLAGRIPLFNYDNRFKPQYTEAKYTAKSYNSIYEREIYQGHECYIGQIDANLNISDGSAEVVLGKNEVIQFRAPNFRTTKTYPAYVNYFLHLKNPGNYEAGIPATFNTLYEFMAEDDRWLTFIKSKTSSGDDIPLKTLQEFEGNEDKVKERYKEVVQKYGALFSPDDPRERVIEKNVKAGIKYRVFEINETTYGLLYSWVKTQNSNQSGKKLLGIFRSLGVDMSREYGRMVDTNKVKYAHCYTYTTSITPLTSLFIQETFASTDKSHTADGLGKDAQLGGIPANSEYQLDEGDWLAINYTPSVAADDGTSQISSPINLIYQYEEKDGKKIQPIIRPNFNLIDSEKYKAAQHTPSKKENYYFENSTVQSTITATGGLFTLNTNEQIELRDFVEVDLTGIGINIYWERNDEDKTKQVGDTIEFTFDEPDEDGHEKSAYTLKDGEYFYYTDNDKIDLAYYGNGTRIIKKPYAPALIKKVVNKTTLADKIANEGLLAALPWVTVTLPENRNLKLREYQYINLIEGDTLKTLNADSEDTKIIGDEINSDKWIPVANATYKLNGSEVEVALPNHTITGAGWEVKSGLNFNCSSIISQTLNTKKRGNVKDTATGMNTDSLTLHYYYRDADGKPVKVDNLKKELTAGTRTIETESGEETIYVPITFTTNYACQSSNYSLDTSVYKYDETGAIDTTEYIDDFSLKLYEDKQIRGKKDKDSKDEDDPLLPLNNYGTGSWTKINFKDYLSTQFNINVPTNDHGLIMFYYTNANKDSTEADWVYLEPIVVDGQELPTLSICNHTGWWDLNDDEKNNKYILRQGLNIVDIPSSCILKISKPDSEAASNATLVFSDLTLVKYDDYDNDKWVYRINPYIKYNQIDSEVTDAEQILKDIKKIDPDYNFYYNAVLDNSTLIDLNTNISPDSANAETLVSSATWYDYNNINNKFVISEIDADYLKVGITLTNSSRR